MTLILLVAALILFILASFRVWPEGRVHLGWLGLACLAANILLSTRPL